MHVDAELAPLAQVQRAAERRGTRLRDDERRRGDRHRLADAPLAGQRLVERALDEPAEIPLRRVDEQRARRVRRRVLEHDRDLDDELLAGRHVEAGAIELERQEVARRS